MPIVEVDLFRIVDLVLFYRIENAEDQNGFYSYNVDMYFFLHMAV